MKRLLACGALLFVASFSPVRAAPHAKTNPDAATFWSKGVEEKESAAVSRPAPVATPTAPELVSAPPVARTTQRKTAPRRAQLLFVVLILCGLASKRRLPQRAFARMRRLHHRPSAAERGRAKVGELRIVAATLGDAEIRTHLDAICGTSDEIFTLFEQRPELSRNSGLIEFTVNHVLTVAASYRDLARTGLPAATPALTRATSLLASIDGNLRNQFERLLEDDLTQLMSAIELLDARLEIEAE
jgi:hypothetical protein